MRRYDPESFLTGAEIDAGFTYDNSRRRWSTAALYDAACRGELTLEDIVRLAPRVRIDA